MRKIYSFFVKCINWLYSKTQRCVYVGQYATNRNFGDALGLLLPELLGLGKAIPQRQCFGREYNKHLNLQLVGSTLADVNKNSIICGIGAVSQDTKVFEKPYKVISVRGPLTRELLIKQGIECPERYGDPALLLPQFYKPHIYINSNNHKYKIGVIPHYVDADSPILKRLQANKDVHIINILLSKNGLRKSVFAEWKTKIDEICSCDCIVSSSLHGLIIADAYRIPTLWVKFSDNINGNDFKFYDYYASLGYTDMHPIDLRHGEDMDFMKIATLKDTNTLTFNNTIQLLVNEYDRQ